MSIFDDVVVNAKSAADVIGKKAGKIADSAKLTITAADIKAEISKKSEILGRVVYVARTTGKSYEKGINELVQIITELNEQLDAVNDQLSDAKSKIKCPMCGMQNVKGSIFCNRCGERIGEAVPDDEDDIPAPDDETVVLNENESKKDEAAKEADDSKTDK